jgi:hypothetical protein
VTTLACWVGVDARGPSSVYVAADSRISWAGRAEWDQARKVYACVVEPHVFGYVGDVLFPVLAIPTVIDLIERGMLAEDRGATRWHRRLLPTLRTLWSDYRWGQSIRYPL